LKFSATSAAQGSCAQALPDAETLKLTPDEAKTLARSIERESRLYLG